MNMPKPALPPISEPITLQGQHVRLELLSTAHLNGLQEAASDGELWNLWYTTVPTVNAMAGEIERRLDLHAKKSMLPFTVFDASGRIVGMTTYMNIDNVNQRLEIGSTWYAKSVQRSALNTECKLMLLSRAFEDLQCLAVELRTHRLNNQSRRAIERLGAQLDGILRQHMRMANGTIRDTVVYSITSTEWPAVKAELLHKLGRHSALG